MWQEKLCTRHSRRWHSTNWTWVWTMWCASTRSPWRNMPTSWWQCPAVTTGRAACSFVLRTTSPTRTWETSMTSVVLFTEEGWVICFNLPDSSLRISASWLPRRWVSICSNLKVEENQNMCFFVYLISWYLFMNIMSLGHSYDGTIVRVYILS